MRTGHGCGWTRHGLFSSLSSGSSGPSDMVNPPRTAALGWQDWPIPHVRVGPGPAGTTPEANPRARAEKCPRIVAFLKGLSRPGPRRGPDRLVSRAKW